MFGQQYFDALKTALSALNSRSGEVENAAAHLFTAVTNGGRVYVYDPSGGIENELVNQNATLALYHSFSTDRRKPAEGDVLLVCSHLPDNREALDAVNGAHAAGTTVTAVAPEGGITRRADIAVINNSDRDHGVITTQGSADTFCPVSGITNAALCWMITAQLAEKLLDDGKTPTFMWGEYLENGSSLREEARRRYGETGY